MKTLKAAWNENPLIVSIVGVFSAAVIAGVVGWGTFVTSTLSQIQVDLANRPSREEIGRLIETESPYAREKAVLQLELKHIREGQNTMQIGIEDMRRTLTEVRDSVIRNSGKSVAK